MYKKDKRLKKGFFLFIAGMLLSAGVLYGCGEKPADSKKVRTASVKEKKEPSLEELAHGEVQLTADALEGYASGTVSIEEDKPERAECLLTMPKIPESDDAYIYLFASECFDDTEELPEKPIASEKKGRNCRISFPYKEEYLFRQFTPTLLIEGEYVPVGKGVYLSNPEALAENQEDYPEVKSKKGILLDPTMLGTEKLTDLGVKHTIYNIPLSIILGETTDEAYPTITYNYEGKDYFFNGKSVSDYDGLFSYLMELGVCSTAVVLNDWNEDHLEMIHPKARNSKSNAYYYMFNTEEEEGIKELQAVASFLTERYSSGEYGMVHNWVFANEINQHKTWNYMDTEDPEYYTREFEKSFRIFYQAAKSHYANARVYFSIDHYWNNNEGDNKEYFNARDIVSAFNDAAAEHGNYDWGVAIHPYPEPLTRVNYWSVQNDKTQEAKILTIMNLKVLTDFLGQKEYLDSGNKIRSIMITELGFSSKAGEKLQAAAFAYCYYIVDTNPYIDAFLLNRQTDAPEEVVSGLAFGLYQYDHSEKYIKEIFRYIDTDQAKNYMGFMLNILGAESLEEALSWAQ